MPSSHPPLSKYSPEIWRFLESTCARAVYCFAVDGKLGTGGSPLIVLCPPAEYRERCLELIALLRRSADLLEQNIGGGSVG